MTDAFLPAFVDRLLSQGRDPGDVPEIPVAEATGWLAPLVSGLLSLTEQGIPGTTAGAFLAHGYAHLSLPARDGRGVYLRLASGCGYARTPWPVAATSVVLTVAGSVDLEMYQRPEDLETGCSQYARSVGPEQAFAVHAGTLCALRSAAGGVQVLAVAQPDDDPGGVLIFQEKATVVQRARRILENLAGAGVGGAR